MRHLPVFDETRSTQPNYGIFAARNMVGKNVTHVRTGELVSEPETPEMEAIVLEIFRREHDEYRAGDQHLPDHRLRRAD
jgi:hypothetical protein